MEFQKQIFLFNVSRHMVVIKESRSWKFEIYRLNNFWAQRDKILVYGVIFQLMVKLKK